MHTILFGVIGAIHKSHIELPLGRLGLDHNKVIKLTHDKLTFTPHRECGMSARNPPDTHWVKLSSSHGGGLPGASTRLIPLPSHIPPGCFLLEHSFDLSFKSQHTTFAGTLFITPLKDHQHQEGNHFNKKWRSRYFLTEPLTPQKRTERLRT